MADFTPRPPDGSTGGDGHTLSTEVPEHFSEYKYTHMVYLIPVQLPVHTEEMYICTAASLLHTSKRVRS